MSQKDDASRRIGLSDVAWKGPAGILREVQRHGGFMACAEHVAAVNLRQSVPGARELGSIARDRHAQVPDALAP